MWPHRILGVVGIGRTQRPANSLTSQPKQKTMARPGKATSCFFLFPSSISSAWSWGQIVAPFFGNIPTARVTPRPVRLHSGATRALQAVRRGKSGHLWAGFPARYVDAPARLAARPPTGGASAQAGARRFKPPRRIVPQRIYRPSRVKGKGNSERGEIHFHFHPHLLLPAGKGEKVG